MSDTDVPVVTKQVRNSRAYFTVTWSTMETISRYRINASVPSMPGIWEMYHLENSRVPRLLKMGAAWLGGVRHKLRYESDPGEYGNHEIRGLLESGDCYYRYTICENRDDLVDVYLVLASIRGVPVNGTESSRRYSDVRVQEPEEMRIRRVRTPSQEKRPPEPYGKEVPNMFDVLREMRLLEGQDPNKS